MYAGLPATLPTERPWGVPIEEDCHEKNMSGASKEKKPDWAAFEDA